jgi:hypothetical protein
LLYLIRERKVHPATSNVYAGPIKFLVLLRLTGIDSGSALPVKSQRWSSSPG